MYRDEQPAGEGSAKREIESLSFDEAAEADRRYWWSRTPRERLEHVERLRCVNYGDRATQRLQRVLELAERE